jgi:hypothetical protein
MKQINVGNFQHACALHRRVWLSETIVWVPIIFVVEGLSYHYRCHQSKF